MRPEALAHLGEIPIYAMLAGGGEATAGQKGHTATILTKPLMGRGHTAVHTNPTPQALKEGKASWLSHSTIHMTEISSPKGSLLGPGVLMCSPHP